MLAFEQLFQINPVSQFPFHTFLYGIDPVASHLASCVQGYITFGNTSVTKVQVADHVTLSIAFEDHTEEYTLTYNDPLGPLSNNPQFYIQNALTMSVRYPFGIDQRGGLEEGGSFEDATYR